MSPRSLLLLFAATFTLGCHAQKPATGSATAVASVMPGKPVSPELAHRIEVLLRQKANLPPGSTMIIGDLRAADVPGWRAISVSFANDGKSSHPIDFLLSMDGKTLAQFNKYDISADPRNLVSAAGRPGRGGPESAPVLIVGFDDLECPYCARLHETIFPAILKRYGSSIHVVYKDFPLDQHPWAMRAAVDVNCLGDQSANGYWNSVDYIHSHAGEIGTPQDNGPKDKTLARANDQIDKLVRDQARSEKADLTKLDACIAKQDTKAVEASRDLGMKLGVDSTPSLFINGDKIDGALPIEFIFDRIDDALRAVGQVPPPPYVSPTPTPATPSSEPVKSSSAPTGK